MTPTRRAMLAIGVGTIALSLVLSIAPALAKNTNSGTVKVHDVATGQDTGSANDPHVCSFWVEFETGETPQTGTWELWSWPPSAKVLVDDGTYSTGPGGQNATPILEPAAGHYQFRWQAAAASSSDTKTLWVDDCSVTEEQATATPSPTVTPSESASESPSTSPSESVVESTSASPSESASESPSTSPSESAVESASASPSESPSESPSTSPSESAVEDPAQSPAASPEGEVLAGNPDGTPPSLPDTSTGFETSGLLAALGILLIVGAHAHARRSKLPERAQ